MSSEKDRKKRNIISERAKTKMVAMVIAENERKKLLSSLFQDLILEKNT